MNYNNGEVLVLKMPAAPTNKLSVKKKTFETSSIIQHFLKNKMKRKKFLLFFLCLVFFPVKKKKKKKNLKQTF